VRRVRKIYAARELLLFYTMLMRSDATSRFRRRMADARALDDKSLRAARVCSFAAALCAADAQCRRAPREYAMMLRVFCAVFNEMPQPPSACRVHGRHHRNVYAVEWTEWI